MHPTDYHYLTKLDEECQYAAARCAMGEKVCMYSKSALSGVESMNKANLAARQRTGIDIINAMILILKLEGERFTMFQHKAWERDEILTKRGLELMQDAFSNINIIEYRIKLNATACNSFHTVRVRKTTSKNEFTVVISTEADGYGSRFGSCTYGKPKKDGIPCSHMAIVAMSSQINGLTRIQVVPYWYTTAHWQAQYALDVNCPTIESIQEVRATSTKDERLYYCPSWTASRKKGRPKEKEREKGVVDHIAESGKKRKRSKKLFCNICHKFDHNTKDCFKNPAKPLFAND
jgi:hypothetical protein